MAALRQREPIEEARPGMLRRDLLRPLESELRRRVHHSAAMDDERVAEPHPEIGIVRRIAKPGFDDLDAPIKRVCTIDAPAIYSPPVETEQLPNTERILKAALEAMA